MWDYIGSVVGSVVVIVFAVYLTARLITAAFFMSKARYERSKK